MKNTILQLCQFHEEKTPSFAINEKLGVYHCFGCGKNGQLKELGNDLSDYAVEKAIKRADNNKKSSGHIVKAL